MSFKDMDKKDLLAVAESFGVEVDGRRGVEYIITELMENGVDYQTYLDARREAEETSFDDPTPEATVFEPDVDKKPKSFSSRTREVLLKMNRENPTFEIRGVKFTKAHPFAVVNETDANYILETVEGFRIASPAEAQEFYDKKR